MLVGHEMHVSLETDFHHTDNVGARKARQKTRLLGEHRNELGLIGQPRVDAAHDAQLIQSFVDTPGREELDPHGIGADPLQ